MWIQLLVLDLISGAGGDPTPPAPVAINAGGDDAKHPGWNRKEWSKRQKRENALEETIRNAFNRLNGIEPEQYEIKEVLAEVAPELATPRIFADYSGVQEWLQAQQFIIERIIQRHMEEEEEEAILALML